MKKILIVDDQNSWIEFNSQSVREVLKEDVLLITASCAKEGYSKILENKNEPFDYILTDMQMESDFVPKMAGEWLIEQIQSLKEYYKTNIIIISAAPMIRHIAQNYNVDFIPKSVAAASIEPFKELLK